MVAAWRRCRSLASPLACGSAGVRLSQSRRAAATRLCRYIPADELDAARTGGRSDCAYYSMEGARQGRIHRRMLAEMMPAPDDVLLPDLALPRLLHDRILGIGVARAA